MRGEYDFSNSEKNPYIKKLQKIAEHPLVDILAKLIKKFKSSKGYWYISRIVILFTIREALAWKWGSVIEAYAQKQLEGTDYGWWWTAVEFVFGIGGSWELALGGLIVFVILSLVKVSEGENNTISLKENFLLLLLLLTLIGMGTYAISSNNTSHNETHKQQKIANDKLDNITALIKLKLGDETLFLEKYFGKDYAVILKHPQTYHNFTTLLKQTNKTANELLKEQEELLKKIESQSFSPKLKTQIDKAFKELRYEDVRELVDIFLEANDAKEQEIINAHYIKALTYMEQVRYLEAKEEFEKIAPNIDNIEILSDYANMYYTLAYYDKALEFHNKSFNLIRETLNLDDVKVMNTYANIGATLSAKGEYNKALRYYIKSLETSKIVDKNNTINLSVIYSNIGVVFKKNENYDEALKYFEKSLKIDMKNKKSIPVRIATTINNIGTLYDSKGEHAKAIKYHMKSLKISLYIYGENNPEVAGVYNNLGAAFLLDGKFKKSILYFQKSSKIIISTLGKSHDFLATIYNNLGTAWKSKGEHDKAIGYYEKALKILRVVFPNGHPYIDITMKNLKSEKESLNNAN